MDRVLTGAIALVKSNGVVIGKMRDINIQENNQRQRIGGIGTILPKEIAATMWSGTLSCSFFEVDFKKSGIPKAIRRDTDGVAASQAGGTNNPSFEDQIVLDEVGVQVDVFKKVTDVIDPTTGLIRPKLEPYAVVGRCFIEGDGVQIADGQVSGRNQSFQYMDPVLEL